MARGRKLAIALGLAVALVAAALIALHSGEGASEARQAAPHTRTASPEAAGATTPSVPPSAAQPVPSEPEPEPVRAARDAGPSDVTQALRATDEHDRALLAAIERQTKASPPQAVYALIALRRQGASREELEHVIANDLSGQLLVRVAAQRWLRAVMPRPGLEPQPAPPPMGQGGGKKLQPIESARPRSR